MLGIFSFKYVNCTWSRSYLPQLSYYMCGKYCLSWFALVCCNDACVFTQTKAEEDISYWYKDFNAGFTGHAKWCSVDAELDSNDKR